MKNLISLSTSMVSQVGQGVHHSMLLSSNICWSIANEFYENVKNCFWVQGLLPYSKGLQSFQKVQNFSQI